MLSPIILMFTGNCRGSATTQLWWISIADTQWQFQRQKLLVVITYIVILQICTSDIRGFSLGSIIWISCKLLHMHWRFKGLSQLHPCICRFAFVHRAYIVAEMTKPLSLGWKWTLVLFCFVSVLFFFCFLSLACKLSMSICRNTLLTEPCNLLEL